MHSFVYQIMEEPHSAVYPPTFQTAQSLIAQPYAAQNLVVHNLTAQNHYITLGFMMQNLTIYRSTLLSHFRMQNLTADKQHLLHGPSALDQAKQHFVA